MTTTTSTSSSFVSPPSFPSYFPSIFFSNNNEKWCRKSGEGKGLEKDPYSVRSGGFPACRRESGSCARKGPGLNISSLGESVKMESSFTPTLDDDELFLFFFFQRATLYEAIL